MHCDLPALLTVWMRGPGRTRCHAERCTAFISTGTVMVLLMLRHRSRLSLKVRGPGSLSDNPGIHSGTGQLQQGDGKIPVNANETITAGSRNRERIAKSGPAKDHSAVPEK
jgi:hypothetical protein